MGLDKKQYAEFKAVLGKNVPKSLDVFQYIKYNEHERWEELKTIKRQTSFVNNAPCETTPKKFSEYLLKPNAKHSNDFFDVGYTQDNPLQLRYDVAKEFDESKAFQKITRNDGAETFNLFMELGVSKKRTFLTGWIKDQPDSKPRIVTGFRKTGVKKMINEFDRVRIIKTGEIGVVIDIRGTTEKFYLIEIDDNNMLADCLESEIEKTDPTEETR